MILHGYHRSGTSYRTRIALNLKGVRYNQVTHNLLRGEQRAADFLALNPQGLVPALEIDGDILIQSPAIIEWLEETYPEPALLPSDPTQRALARSMAAMIACDVHPLNNVRVLNALRDDFAANADQIKAWAQRWIEAGFAALEPMIARHGGSFAFGDTPTVVDCYLVPQLYSAKRFDVDLSPYPRIQAAAEMAGALPPIAAAHPDLQPDAPSP